MSNAYQRHLIETSNGAAGVTNTGDQPASAVDNVGSVQVTTVTQRLLDEGRR